MSKPRKTTITARLDGELVDWVYARIRQTDVRLTDALERGLYLLAQEIEPDCQMEPLPGRRYVRKLEIRPVEWLETETWERKPGGFEVFKHRP